MAAGLNRRGWLASAGALASGSLLGSPALGAEAAAPPQTRPAAAGFRYCFNTATIRGQKVPLVETVELVAQAGYQALEPWVDELHGYVQKGGSLPDLRKRIEDRGLTVENAIGFPTWIVDDAEKRRQGLEAVKRDLEVVRAVGGKRIAAPPVGATDRADLSLLAAAERYAALLELARGLGVGVQLEHWGGSKVLSRLSEAVFVAMESRQSDACVLPDIFHMFRGGSDFGGLRFVHGAALHVFHVNDYPGQLARTEANDSQRLFPGDGVAPLTDIFRTLRDIGFSGVLSLELFNREYWKQDPAQVARTGLEKMRTAVQQALS